jgi:hypothetical protein
MASSVYSNIVVYLDGKLLSEESSATINFKSGKQPVFTVTKGLAGFSLGADYDEIQLECNVPADDFEINPSQLIHDTLAIKQDPSYNVWHEITLIAASRTYTSSIFFTDASISHSVDGASKISLSGTAKPATFQ